MVQDVLSRGFRKEVAFNDTPQEAPLRDVEPQLHGQDSGIRSALHTQDGNLAETAATLEQALECGLSRFGEAAASKAEPAVAQNPVGLERGYWRGTEWVVLSSGAEQLPRTRRVVASSRLAGDSSAFKIRLAARGGLREIRRWRRLRGLTS